MNKQQTLINFLKHPPSFQPSEATPPLPPTLTTPLATPTDLQEPDHVAVELIRQQVVPHKLRGTPCHPLGLPVVLPSPLHPLQHVPDV